MYLEELVNLSFEDLFIKCNNIYETITITEKEALNIESQTRNRAKGSKWYELRAGQMTASVMKEAISTKIESPSLLLTKKICCRRKFRDVATDWSIEHKKPAKDCCFNQNSNSNSNFTIQESGLVRCKHKRWLQISNSVTFLFGQIVTVYR